jgi:hypothetical protein
MENRNGRKTIDKLGGVVMITQELLELAMKKAVEVGLIPKFANGDTYLKNWEGMRKVLEEVLQFWVLTNEGR